MLGFVEPSLMLTRMATRLGLTNVAWLLMGEKLRLSPWSGGEKFSARYVAYKTAALVIRVF